MGQKQQVEMNVFDAGSLLLEKDLHKWLAETADVQLRLAVIYQRDQTGEMAQKNTKQREIEKFLTQLAQMK